MVTLLVNGWPTLPALFVFSAVILTASRVDACSCAGGGSLADYARTSDLVFVGRVTAIESARAEVRALSDGSGSVGGGRRRKTATLDVEKVYRGDIGAVAHLRSDWDSCDLTFTVGEVWLVYAMRRDDGIETSKCSRSRLVANGRADLEYFEGLHAGRPQGIVYGDLLRRGYDGAGRPVLLSPLQTTRLMIAALSDGRRIEIEPGWGEYQLVLPPGPATVWVEKDGLPVMAPLSVSVTDKGEHRVSLITEFDEQARTPAAVPR
jgi:hypothetical protein